MPKKGYKQTSEHKRKTSLLQIGNKNGLGHTLSLQKRKELSERMKGNKINVGRKCSQLTKIKIGKANSIALKGRKIPLKNIKKQLLTKIKKGIMINPIFLSDFQKYYSKVWIITRNCKKELFNNWNGYCFYTNKNILKYYNKKDYNQPNYPVMDHKYSIFNGFKNTIKPEIIGGIDNLCICTRKINGVKNINNEVI